MLGGEGGAFRGEILIKWRNRGRLLVHLGQHTTTTQFLVNLKIVSIVIWILVIVNIVLLSSLPFSSSTWSWSRSTSPCKHFSWTHWSSLPPLVFLSLVAPPDVGDDEDEDDNDDDDQGDDVQHIPRDGGSNAILGGKSWKRFQSRMQSPRLPPSLCAVHYSQCSHCVVYCNLFCFWPLWILHQKSFLHCTSLKTIELDSFAV